MPASGTSTVAVPLTAEPPTGERVAVQLVAMGLASTNRSPTPAHSVSLRDSIFPFLLPRFYVHLRHTLRDSRLPGLMGRWRRNAAPAPALLERRRHKPPPDMKR